MSHKNIFARDYQEARGKFHAAAQASDAVLRSFDHPEHGPGGEQLACDTAWYGEKTAERVVVTISATHGVEGFSGSGVQVGWFEAGMATGLPVGMAYLAIHAINPHGFAWLRRVTEENVDLNRNFVDFTKTLPVNEAYVELADTICPSKWDEETITATDKLLEAYAEKHGKKALQNALTGGQYSHPDGICYGGSRPVWSNRLLRKIFAEELATARSVAVVDFHTGLGPRGQGERICPHLPDSPDLARAKEWFAGDLTCPFLGNSSSAEVSGYNVIGMSEALGKDKALTAIALEYGTLRDNKKLAMRADNWLHLHGDPDSEQGRAIKAQIREAFYQEADDWKEMIWDRAVETLRLAIKGLDGS